MKLLVLAFYAQFRVSAGNEDFLGDRNGIRQPSQLVAETYLCGYFFIYELGLNLLCGAKL